LTLAAVVLWGCAPIGVRYMVGSSHAGLPALPFVAMRYSIAALIYTPILFGAPRRWSRRDWVLGGIYGLLGITSYNLLSAFGQRSVSAGLTGLLNGISPLLIVIFSAVLHRRMPSAWTIVATIIGLAGIVLLAHGAGPAQGDVFGITLILISALSWALYCVLSPALIRRRGAVPVTAVAMTIGALPLLAAGGPQMPGVIAHLSALQWEILIGLVLGMSITAFLCWNIGSGGLGAEQAGWFLYLMPVVSLLGGAAILHEPLTAVEFFGGGLIMLSVFLSQRTA
jgi:drug/metabolite transporter (DMT)-like permease